MTADANLLADLKEISSRLGGWDGEQIEKAIASLAYVLEKPKLRVQYVGPTNEQVEKAWASKIVNEGDVRLVWIVEADLWPMDGRYEVQEFKQSPTCEQRDAG